jgi:hypothetical protein
MITSQPDAERLASEWSATADCLRAVRRRLCDLVFEGNHFQGMPLQVRQVLVEGWPSRTAWRRWRAV